EFLEAIFPAAKGMLAHLVGLDAQLPLLDRRVQLRSVARCHRNDDPRHCQILQMLPRSAQFPSPSAATTLPTWGLGQARREIRPGKPCSDRKFISFGAVLLL